MKEDGIINIDGVDLQLSTLERPNWHFDGDELSFCWIGKAPKARDPNQDFLVWVSIEERNIYCDRGHYLVKIHRGEIQMNLDSGDSRPNYYMHLETAKHETIKWLRWRLFGERAESFGQIRNRHNQVLLRNMEDEELDPLAEVTDDDTNEGRGWMTWAQWPKDANLSLGNELCISEDRLETLGLARGVTRGLKRHGFGGDGEIFPIAVGIYRIMEVHGEGDCPKCGGDLKDGKALISTFVWGGPDFPGDTADSPGQTFSAGGPGVIVDVDKCGVCGYSRTKANPKPKKMVPSEKEEPKAYGKIELGVVDTSDWPDPREDIRENPLKGTPHMNDSLIAEIERAPEEIVRKAADAASEATREAIERGKRQTEARDRFLNVPGKEIQDDDDLDDEPLGDRCVIDDPDCESCQ